MKTQRWGLWVVVMGLVMVTMACNDVAVTPGYSAMVGTTATAFLPAAEAARLAVIMTATAEAEATRAAEAAVAATATMEGYLLEVARINATATAAAIQMTATAEARAWEATATAEARASAEAQARWEWSLTATAEAHAPTATAEAQAITARELMLAEQERQAAEAARRDEMLRPVQVYGPVALLVIGVLLVVYAILRLITVAELRGRAIQRDARGDAPIMVLPQGRGRLVVYDGDRAFGPATMIDAVSVTMPALADEQQQAAVTMRDQAVDLATRGLPRPETRSNSGQARRQAAQRMGTALPSAGQIRVIEPGQVRGWLRDVTPQALALTLEEVGHE